MPQEGWIGQAPQRQSHFISRLQGVPAPQSGHPSEVLARTPLILGPAPGPESQPAVRAVDKGTFVSVLELGIKAACFSWEVKDTVPVLQLGPQCLFISFIPRLLVRSQSTATECW